MSNKRNNRVKVTDAELKDKLVTLNRVAKVTKGGRTFSFAAIVVVGDGNGNVGHGLGKAREVASAITKATEDAKKNMINVPVYKGTIPHPQNGKYGAGKVLICAPKGNPVYAVNVGREMAHKPVLAWDSKDKKNITSDVPTPLFYDEFFYVLSDLKKTITKLDPNEGNLVWELPLPGKYKWRSSPTAGDNKIYLMNHNAHVYVISALDGSIIHSAKMGEEYDDSTRSSIALSAGALYIRTNKILYCIEE